MDKEKIEKILEFCGEFFIRHKTLPPAYNAIASSFEVLEYVEFLEQMEIRYPELLQEMIRIEKTHPIDFAEDGERTHPGIEVGEAHESIAHGVDTFHLREFQ